MRKLDLGVFSIFGQNSNFTSVWPRMTLVLSCRYLAEIGALHLFSNDDTPLSLEHIYNKVAEGKNGCSLEYYEAYKHLKSLGYIVGRHGIPWSVRRSKVNCVVNQDPLETSESGDEESRNNILISEMFSNMQIGGLRLVFDVYPPNSRFRKSAPGDPCFVLCLARYGTLVNAFIILMCQVPTKIF